MEYFGDEVDRIVRINPVTGEIIDEMKELWVYPATHYAASEERLERAMVGIQAELRERLAELEQQGNCSRRSGSACVPPTTWR